MTHTLTLEELEAQDAIDLAAHEARLVAVARFNAAKEVLRRFDNADYIANAAEYNAYVTLGEGEVEGIEEDNAVFWNIAYASIGSLVTDGDHMDEMEALAAAGFPF